MTGRVIFDAEACQQVTGFILRFDDFAVYTDNWVMPVYCQVLVKAAVATFSQLECRQVIEMSSMTVKELAQRVLARSVDRAPLPASTSTCCCTTLTTRKPGWQKAIAITIDQSKP